MSIENARIECFAKPITHAFIHFKNDNERDKYIRRQILHLLETQHSLDLISMNWTLKHLSVKGQIVVKTCQSGSLQYIKYQDIGTEVEGQVEILQSNQTIKKKKAKTAAAH